jgi:hypothetical protein
VRRLAILVAVIAMSSVVMTATATAGVPVTFEQDCEFNLAVVNTPDVPSWICSETIDGVTYHSAAFPIGSGKAFEAVPAEHVMFFEEKVLIYESLDYEFVGGVLVTFEPGNVLFEGIDRGIVNARSNWYVGNGTVQYATGPFEGMEGHRYHASGPISWYPFGAPYQSIGGTFRIM